MVYKTMTDKELDLGSASAKHAMLQTAIYKFAPTQFGSDSMNRSIVALDRSRFLDTIWKALVGAPVVDDGCNEIAWQGVTLTIPNTALALLRKSNSIPAAFAFSMIVESLLASGAALDNDLDVRDAMRSAWANWDVRRKQANNVEEGFGCDDSQSWHTLRDVLDKHDPHLFTLMQRIAKLAGRMFDAMSYTRKQVQSDDPQEVRSATTGGDVARLLPAELAKLGNGSTRDQTIMRIVKKEAAVFEMGGIRSKSRGPMVLAIDESGSMHDHGAAEGRNTWAKAAAVALTRIAWAENRAVRCVHLGMATVTQDIPRDDTDALWQMARSFLSGGTCFEAALSAARIEVGDLEKAGLKGADIVLITDGEDPDHDKHIQELSRMDKAGIRLWTVSIGGEMDKSTPVRARAELYIHARDVDLSDAKTAVDLAAQLKSAALANPKASN